MSIKDEIISLEPIDYLVRSGKGLITSMGLKTIVMLKKIKKARFYIPNVSLKDCSKIIKEFYNFPFKVYVRKMSKQMPTDSYFYLEDRLQIVL